MDSIATIGSIQSIFPILVKQIIHFFKCIIIYYKQVAGIGFWGLLRG